MSQVIAPSDMLWRQAHQVRDLLTGAPWHKTFRRTPPLPGWLVALVEGRIASYVGPDPVLFRTAAIGREWFHALDEHRDQLEITSAHRDTEADVLREAAALLGADDGVVDADSYVYGDGDADGEFSVRIHRLYGIYPSGSAVPAAVLRALGGPSSAFIVDSRRTASGTTVEVTPRLARRPGEAWW